MPLQLIFMHNYFKLGELLNHIQPFYAFQNLWFFRIHGHNGVAFSATF